MVVPFVGCWFICEVRKCNTAIEDATAPSSAEENGDFSSFPEQAQDVKRSKRLKLSTLSTLSITPAKESFLDDFRNSAHDS